MDLKRLKQDIKNIDWSAISLLNDVDSMVDSLTAELIDMYDRHTPVTPVLVKTYSRSIAISCDQKSCSSSEPEPKQNQ